MPKTVDSTEIGNVFEQFGPVEEVTLFRTNLNAQQSKVTNLDACRAAWFHLQALAANYLFCPMKAAELYLSMSSPDVLAVLLTCQRLLSLVLCISRLTAYSTCAGLRPGNDGQSRVCQGRVGGT